MSCYAVQQYDCICLWLQNNVGFVPSSGSFKVDVPVIFKDLLNFCYEFEPQRSNSVYHPLSYLMHAFTELCLVSFTQELRKQAALQVPTGLHTANISLVCT